ncbi:TipAS antibiotic-recognition domain-containing protein [Lentibacillus sediminis]|uniref:TipAS antibiotic-recognition domain-containing protein n=1 Tax=Lentibacillus sediminis TaxID=1940529 RepID=UPI000C1BDBE0|nr:TipAS antibiotic-recognition domain-containing protein [Lentibacillus sediminis]
MNWEAIFDTFLHPKLSQQIRKYREKNLTKEEQEAISKLPKVGKDHEEVDKWVKLVNDIWLHIEKPPSSPEAQDLARRWMENVDSMFQGDRELSRKALNVYKEKGRLVFINLTLRFSVL